MSRCRLLQHPRPAGGAARPVRHARYVWNLAVEQHSHWHPGRKGAPGYLEQCRQLTPRALSTRGWPPVQSPAASLRELAQRWRRSSTRATRPGGCVAQGRAARGTARGGRPAVGRRRVPRTIGQVWAAQGGWVRFRWSGPVPATRSPTGSRCDLAGRWHIAFAAIPGPFPPPVTARRWASTGAWRSPRPCPPARCCTAPP